MPCPRSRTPTGCCRSGSRRRVHARTIDSAPCWPSGLALGSSSDAVLPVEEVLSRVVAPLAAAGHGAVAGRRRHELRRLSRARWGPGTPGLDGAGRGRSPDAAAGHRRAAHRSRRCRGRACSAARLRRGTSQVERTASPPSQASSPSRARVRRRCSFTRRISSTGQASASPRRCERRSRGRPARSSASSSTPWTTTSPRATSFACAWTTDAIRPLGWLLDAARDAGRIVVLTSDHGHVLDRDPSYRRHETDSLRCRPDDGAPGPDELLSAARACSPLGRPRHRALERARALRHQAERLPRRGHAPGGRRPARGIQPRATRKSPAGPSCPARCLRGGSSRNPSPRPIPAGIRVVSPPLVARPPSLIPDSAGRLVHRARGAAPARSARHGWIACSPRPPMPPRSSWPHERRWPRSVCSDASWRSTSGAGR